MKKFKCVFTSSQILSVLDIINDKSQSIETSKPHELSEILVHRLFTLMQLSKRFKNKSMLMHPKDTFKMSFDLREVLTLKYCLFDYKMDIVISDIFMKLDRYIIPAIQLEF